MRKHRLRKLHQHHVLVDLMFTRKAYDLVLFSFWSKYNICISTKVLHGLTLMEFGGVSCIGELFQQLRRAEQNHPERMMEEKQIFLRRIQKISCSLDDLAGQVESTHVLDFRRRSNVLQRHASEAETAISQMYWHAADLARS